MLDEVLKTGLQTKTQFPAVVFDDDIPASDEMLVRSVLAGDETSFELLFDRYRRPIARVVGRFFREQADIEEFVQQAFTKAYFSLKDFRGDSPFKGWITRIAVNVCYDEFRRRQRKGESLFAEMSSEETDYIETVIDRRQKSADSSVIAAQLVEKVMAGLDAEDRVAMTLVYSEEYSLDEAAAAIGITTSNLKSRLFRCRNHLKKRFGHFFK